MTTGASLVGKRFGKQVVLRAIGDAKVEVRCDCGTVKATRFQYLVSGESNSCGCARRDPRPGSIPIEVGSVFDRLTVIQLLGANGGAKREVLVSCECTARKVVLEGDLRSGNARSCGCYRRDRMANLNKSHGQAGRRRTPLYRAWESLKRRVADPKRYPTYIGVTVFPEWQAFEPFRDYVDKHLGPRPDGYSLDRIENDRGYEPGNIRWANSATQSRNKGSNRIITVDGVSLCVADWAVRSGITALVICARRRNGWPDHLAVTLPNGSNIRPLGRKAKPKP